MLDDDDDFDEEDEVYDDEVVAFEEVRAIGATALAVLCVIDDDKVWVPLSQIHDDSDVWRKGDHGTLVVRSWWAEKEGLL